MKAQIQLLNTILIIALGGFFKLAAAQAPNIQWQKCIGGSGDDVALTILKLSDGNYLSCGTTSSVDGDFNSTHGKYDAFLLKTDSTGKIIWSKTYGGSSNEAFQDVKEETNGNLIAIGWTNSNNGQVSGNHSKDGSNDAWVIHTDNNGNLLSQHCYGGSGDDYGTHLAISDAGAIVFTGYTSSNDGDVSNNHGDYDAWVMKVEESGAIDFSVCVGDTSYQDFVAITRIDGDYLVGGTTSILKSDDPNLITVADAHVARIDQSGNIIYYRKYGGTRSDNCNSIVPSADGNAVLCGHTSSSDGDVSGNYGFNMWIYKLNFSTGDIMWENYTGIPNDTAASFNLFATADGGFVEVGAIAPNLLYPWKTWDAYATKVDANGNTLWTKRFGGGKFDAVQNGVEENDGSLLLVGQTRSNNKDVSGNHGGRNDAWMVNLSSGGERISSPENAPVTDLKNYPNPFSQSTVISFQLEAKENVSLKIYDLQGRLIRTFVNKNMNAGEHSLTWNASDENGNALSDGIYFLKMEADNEVKTIALSVMR